MTVIRLKGLEQAIDQAIYAVQGTPGHQGGPRRHLGASVVARACEREVWYSFRWATDVRFEGRMLRLFDRGHDEEARFIRFLAIVGINVIERDTSESATLWYAEHYDKYLIYENGTPEQQGDEQVAREFEDVTDILWHVERAKTFEIFLPAPKQFRVIGYMGHFGGSMDGIATGFGSFIPIGLHERIRPDEPLLAEMKTHGRKSFDILDQHPDGVRGAKPEHFGQMQKYMQGKGLRWGIYCAVCKDTDRLYFELIEYEEGYALALEARAQRIIDAKRPPKRIHESPSWHGCRFCDHKPCCKLGQQMKKSCRTCELVEVAKEGRWFCTKWQRTIPIDAEAVGCDYWVQIKG